MEPWNHTMSIRNLCALFVIFASMVSGCATFELEGNGSITPDAITNSETVHGSLYGFRWRPFSVEKCEADSLFRVEFHTNAVFLLASTLSLGLYVPQTVEWWCYTPASTADQQEEEIWIPPAQTNER